MDAKILETEDTAIYVLPHKRVIAENVPYEEYLTGKYGQHVEWVQGVVIAMSPIAEEHDQLMGFLRVLFGTYLHFTGGGRVLQDPMVMKTAPDLSGRQPDIQVLLPDRMHLLQPTQVAGAANLVVEIASPSTEDTDRGAKFREYEQGGVSEYWILDRKRRDPLFYVLGEDGLYHRRSPVDGVYTSVVLPKLKLNVDVLWQAILPSPPETVKMVEDMLKE
jgi:Uma2 family endonuclease